MTEDAFWFAEPPQAGQQPRLRLRARLHERDSRFQRIEVVDSELFGRTLVLDGMVQTTERDEFFYHEMLVHPALLSHARPRSVLIIGGGDGGALRRALEHGLERATLVEIDPEVVEVSRAYLPEVSAGAFDDPRAEVRFEDGYAFVRDTEERFDAVIVDAPDPIGPGRALYSQDFYRALFAVLREDGVAAIQAESPLLMATQTAATYLHLRGVFPAVRMYLGAAPAYPGVLWTFALAAKGALPDRDEVARRFQERGLRTRYYTPEVQEAAFVLPAFLSQFLEESVRLGQPAEAHPFFPVAQGVTVGEPSQVAT